VEEYFAEDSYKKYPHGLFNTLADENVDDSMFDTITYQKGGAVVHMLRETIGDEAFWKAINIYLERHKFGNVESADLQKVMEEVSRTNLEWFFSQWVYGGGYPKLIVRQSFDAKSSKLQITFSQIQKSDSLIPNAFILPLEIKIKTIDGETIEKITLKKREEVFNFSFQNKPISIEIDPEERIPLKTVKLQNLEIKASHRNT
jgi:aminopeptidase N